MKNRNGCVNLEMKRVILDIDDRYANVLTVTLVGHSVHWDALRGDMHVTTSSFDITKCDHITVGEDGKFTQEAEGEGE